MRRTFGLTALLLLALVVVAIAGCSGAGNSGAGVLQPFPTGTHTGGPTVSPTVSPSISPFPTGTATVLPSRNNPTRLFYNAGCGELWFLEGFNLGANNGRLVRTKLDTQNGTSQSDPTSPQVFTLAFGDSTPVQLTNPVWIDGGTDPVSGEFFLVVTDNFGTAQGRILIIKPAISASCQYTGTAVVTDLGALASSAPINPLGVDFDGRYVWWTEYVGTPQGRVRRADLAASPIAVVDYMVGLDFPAGIMSNGAYAAFAQNGAGSFVAGPVVPITGTVFPIPIVDPQVGVLTPAIGDPVMIRPWEVHWTGNNTLVTLDGFGMTVAGGPGSAGVGNGNLRFFTGPGTNWANKTLNIVQGGLTDPVGLGVIYDAAADATKNRVDVAFAQSVPTTGTVNRIGFQTTTPFTVLNNQVLITNVSRAFHALPVPTVTSPVGAPPVSEPAPTNILLFITQGFDLGVANGNILRFSGAFGL